MKPEGEVVVKEDGGIAFVTLNRLEKKNALSPSLLDSLAESMRGLSEGGTTRCAVLEGAGGTFSVGMDLEAVAAMPPGQGHLLIGEGGPLRNALAAVEQAPFAVIAMIRGHAAGAACELAVTCDLRVGSANALMGMPPAKLGIVYPAEGLERFIWTVGTATTRRLFYTSRYFGGEELLRMGLLDFMCEDEELEEFTMELAEAICRNSPVSMAGHKGSLRLISGAASLSPERRAVIDELVRESFASADAAEGIAAFKEKREPEFGNP